MKAVSILTVVVALTGCATQPMTPTQSTLAQTIQTQYAAGVDALNAYCSIAATDPDIAKICAPALSAVNSTEVAVHAVIGQLVSLLAKKALQEAVEQRSRECHD